MTNLESIKSMEPNNIIKNLLIELCKIQESILEEEMTIRNQMIMTGICYTAIQQESSYLGDFHVDLHDELSKILSNQEIFYNKSRQFFKEEV